MKKGDKGDMLISVGMFVAVSTVVAVPLIVYGIEDHNRKHPKDKIKYLLEISNIYRKVK